MIRHGRGNQWDSARMCHLQLAASDDSYLIIMHCVLCVSYMSQLWGIGNTFCARLSLLQLSCHIAIWCIAYTFTFEKNVDFGKLISQSQDLKGFFFFNLEGNLAFLYIKTHSYLWEFDLHHCLDFASCEILPPPPPHHGLHMAAIRNIILTLSRIIKETEQVISFEVLQLLLGYLGHCYHFYIPNSTYESALYKSLVMSIF